LSHHVYHPDPDSYRDRDHHVGILVKHRLNR
jgi:hypothetical protein